MISAMFLLAQVSGNPVIPAAANAYGDCVREQAVRLSKSAESAEIVATAVLTICQRLLPAAALAMREASNAELEKRGWPATGSVIEMQEGLEKQAQNLALTIVVEERLRARVR